MANHTSTSRSTGMAIQFGLFFTAALISLIWGFYANWELLLKALNRANIVWVGCVPAILLCVLSLKLVRWHYLLRSVGVLVPIRPSIRIYLAGLSMTLTPYYLGEFAKAFWLKKISNVSSARLAALVIVERLFDISALAVLGLILSARADIILAQSILLVSAVLLTALLCILVWRSRHALGINNLRHLQVKTITKTTRICLMAGVLSLAAWALGGLAMVAAALGLTVSSPAGELVGVFAESTLLGAFVPSPGGAGVSGSMMISALRELKIDITDATAMTIITRVGTYWFSVVIGFVFLRQLVQLFSTAETVDQSAHFEALTDDYSEEIPDHIRDYLLAKKIDLMVPWFDGKSGLDIGCGQGWYASELSGRGFEMTGVDQALPSSITNRTSRDIGVDFQTGDVLDLPFDSNMFDFAYCVNVIHHILDRGQQLRAIQESIRILKPGKRLIIHEMNVVNPIFRLYMGYFFPIIRNIDLGDEIWLDPRNMPQVDGSRIVHTGYYTLIPDFLPEFLLEKLRPVEKRFEQSRFAMYSAHFFVVYEKEAK